jgi:hypothetical protein
MYIGAGLVLASAALFYESLPLLGYAVFSSLATHLFVVWYEEPTLRRTFGKSAKHTAARLGDGGRAYEPPQRQRGRRPPLGASPHRDGEGWLLSRDGTSSS